MMVSTPKKIDNLHSWRWDESRGLFHVVIETEVTKTVGLSFGVRTIDRRLLEFLANGTSLLTKELVSGPWIQFR